MSDPSPPAPVQLHPGEEPCPDERDVPPRLSYRFSLRTLYTEVETGREGESRRVEVGCPPRDILTAVEEVLRDRSSEDPGATPIRVYAVDADGIEPDQLLRLLHDVREQRRIADGLGFFLLLTRSRQLGDWMPPAWAASTGLASHLKENEFALQTLVRYGVARFVPVRNVRGEHREPRFELKARLHRMLGRKQEVFPLQAALRTITRDAEALCRIARLELGGDAAPARDGASAGAGDEEDLARRIVEELGATERFLGLLRVLYQLGRRRHVDAEAQVTDVFPGRKALGSVALRRRGTELLDRLARDWNDAGAVTELKQVHTALRAYEVLRDLGEWLAFGAHRWAAHLKTMRILVIDETLTDLTELDDVEPDAREDERRVHEDQRTHLTQKIERIVTAFGGRAEVLFDYVTGPKVWAEVRKLLNDGPLTSPKGTEQRIYVRRMDFGAPPGVGQGDRHLCAADLLDYDLVLIEVEFRNYYIGPQIVQKLSELLERLASLPRPGAAGRRAGPPSLVVLSQSANFSYVQQCLNLGADAYVRKERMYELPMRAVRARITHRRPEPRGQKSNFRALYSLFPEVTAVLQSEDPNQMVLGRGYDVLDRDWIEALPKADLHTHIGTCIDSETVEALAFNTAGHLIARREKTLALMKDLEPLLDLVCRVAVETTLRCQERDGGPRDGCWLGDHVEEALETVAPAPDGTRGPWGGKTSYERVLHRIWALHPRVKLFEVTALLVAAFAVARQHGVAGAVAATAKKRWEYLDELARLAVEAERAEQRCWPLEPLRRIAASLRLASDDLYGLRQGDHHIPHEVLREQAESSRRRVELAAHCLSSRLHEVVRRPAAPDGQRDEPLPEALEARRAALRRQGPAALPPVPTLPQLVMVPDPRQGEGQDLLKYLRGTALLGADHLQHPENLLLAARSVAEQMSRENVIYCELRCETIGYTEASMGAIQATDLLCRALDVAAVWWATRGGRPWTRFNVLLGAKRHKGPDKFRKIVSLAEHYLQRQSTELPAGEPAVPDWWRPCAVAGFDLSGDEGAEMERPEELIRPLFLYSAPITIHAGEAASAESIWRAVYEYGARRIGHGLRLRENTRLLNYCISEGICMELCPISNQYTNAFPYPADRYSYDSDWREYYPLRYYLERGLDVCINTDNRQLHRRGALTDDYMCAARLVGGLTRWELLRIVKAGFKHAFLPKREIEVLLRAVESQVYELVTTP